MMKNANGSFQKLLSGYSFTAVTLLNTLLAIVIVNVFLSAVFFVIDSFSPASSDLGWNDPVSRKYGKATASSVYPNLKEGEIQSLLHETWFRPLIYSPFTQFRERPYRGSYVNVDINGFRVTKNQGPWPPKSNSINIFIFGGSTTFGYGVMDNQTIPSYLQDYLTKTLDKDIRIYNFGQGNYFSTQERILFEKLLLSGFVPDMAIFIDGLNDFYFNNEPKFTDRLREFMAQGPRNNQKNWESIQGLFSQTSLGRAANGLRNLFFQLGQEKQLNEERNEQTEVQVNGVNYAEEEVSTSVINRYVKNKELIEAVSNSQGVIPIFVWQPVPTYHYDQRYHPFTKLGYGQHTYSQYGYIAMAQFHEKNALGKNFLWCADIQETFKEALYLDQVHYSSKFSKKFAQTIGELIIKRSLLGLKLNIAKSKM